MVDYKGTIRERSTASLLDVSDMLKDFEEGDLIEDSDGSFYTAKKNGLKASGCGVNQINGIYRTEHRILRNLINILVVSEEGMRATERIGELEKKVAELESRLEEKDK